jgi:four helix bundle protein
MQEAAMQHFKNLKVWERSHALTLDVYKLSKVFPREELYGLTSQMRRASVSVGANIAEGACRGGDADFARFIQMAAGSASELEYHLLLAHDLEFLRQADYERLSTQTQEVKRMLAALLHKLKADG